MRVSFQVPTLPMTWLIFCSLLLQILPCEYMPCLIETNISSHVNQIWNIYRRRQVPFIAYQNTSILPLYVLGKRIDVPSCNVECNERKVDWHDERSLGNLFWLHSQWWYPGGKEHFGVNITLEVEYWPTLASGSRGYVDVDLSPYLGFRNSLWTGMILLVIS